MEPLSVQIARELAEEIRTNTALRHRLGMQEGDESAQLDGPDSNQIAITTSDGDTFFIVVQEG
jgi:hypothetical protein